MRDPERIDAIIEELREKWKARPDWRLGQLIYNIARTSNPRMTPCPELFRMEDEQLRANIRKMDEPVEWVSPIEKPAEMPPDRDPRGGTPIPGLLGAPRHNHLTRDIKPKGKCPACDLYHAGVRR